ncbi:2-phosphoxylose phosphatase 1 [Chrysoperla carnea]|uniref:2-phosphoxylose phosphatase 1 n=1 Tax=Chrysoperla carnea TaxID=189513 RepID=UPI001D0917BA|nr:2-phosphoxylose phosphatase 1 [Chrysoperla carnea]
MTSSQQRARYCYLALSIWIFFLMAATYKYLGSNDTATSNSINNNYKLSINNQNSISRDFSRNSNFRNKRIFSVCNDPENINYGSEGLLTSSQWQLKEVIVLIRHGDRGPLAHIRNISAINCGLNPKTSSNILLTQYKNFINEITQSGHLPWSQTGPFHGFPLLPSSDSQCHLAQLTYIGVAQLLNIGRMLSNVYIKKLQLENSTTANVDDILVYSTKYRRTFQSGLAFLYGFLPPELLTKVQIKESDSVTFCFTDCACPAADHYSRLVQEESNENLESHPAVLNLVREAASIMYEVPEKSLFKNPTILKDSLLTYICHDSTLPCIIENQNFLRCIKTDQVASLFTYIDWENQQHTKNVFLKRSCLLKAYGLIRNIVTQMLKHVSDSKPKFVLYSGHDWALQYLCTALGVKQMNDVTQYASRLIFEIYKDVSNTQTDTSYGVVSSYMFRFLANGRDVTKDLSFCKDNLLKLGYNIYGCKIEAIVRFLHDDYFSSLNVTNFKDACRL